MKTKGGGRIGLCGRDRAGLYKGFRTYERGWEWLAKDRRVLRGGKGIEYRERRIANERWSV